MCASFDGPCAGLVPSPCGPVLLFGAADGVISFDGCVVVGAYGELLVVRKGRPVCGFVCGIGEDGTGGVASVGALERDLENHIEEALLPGKCGVVGRRAVDFCLFVGRPFEKLDDFLGGGHGNDAGGNVVGTGAAWGLPCKIKVNYSNYHLLPPPPPAKVRYLGLTFIN